MRLTSDQQRLLREKLTELMKTDKLKHLGLLGEKSPDWDRGGWVMGLTDDITSTGIKRACRDCGEDVYTSIKYPDDVPIICEGCAFKLLVGEEAGTR